MIFNKIKLSLYATWLTNRFGFKLAKTDSDIEKAVLRLQYCETLLAKMNVSVVVKNPEALPKQGQFLMLTNHRGIIDPVVLEVAFKPSEIFGAWIAKKELYNSFFFGKFVRNARTVLLDREAKSMSHFFTGIKEQVKAGRSIYIFPEGTRNKDDIDLAPFKDGTRIISLKNRLNILPVCIRTRTDEVLHNALKNMKKPQTVEVEIGQVIDYKDRSVDLEQAYRKMFGLQQG